MKSIGFNRLMKQEEDDIIIVLYNNELYRINDIKKKKLFNKKVNGKIFWL